MIVIILTSSNLKSKLVSKSIISSIFIVRFSASDIIIELTI